MRFWKDHPKEIKADPDFPPWKGKSNAPPVTAASLALPSEIAARKPSSSGDEHKPKHRGFWKKALGLGSTTPPPPDSYLYDPRAERFQRMRAEAKKAPRPKETGRVFDCQGREITGQIASRRAPVVPKFDRRNFAPRRPRAEPITTGYWVGAGIGWPAGGSAAPKRQEPAGEDEHRRKADSSGVQQTPG